LTHNSYVRLSDEIKIIDLGWL